MTQKEVLQEYLLRLADSDMILGQRLSELTGKAPAVEEELAVMNVALDLVGQARNWYEYAAELINDGRDADKLVHYFTLKSLVNASDERVATIAAKAVKEATYHLRRSSEWVKRMGDGTEESHRRIQDAFNLLWRFTGELITPDEVDHAMFKAGIGPDPEQLKQDWFGMVREVAAQATLTVGEEDAWMYMGGKRGEHTEHLGHILAVMQFLPRAYPDATTW